jgi:hypothetical protein
VGSGGHFPGPKIFLFIDQIVSTRKNISPMCFIPGI